MTAQTKSAQKLRARNDVPEEVDVAIVGCGIGGLTCGAYLAQAGYKVALFDPHYVAGGCTTVFKRTSPLGTYNFDIGLHYVGDCQPGGMIPRLLDGVGVEQEFIPLDPDGFDTLVFPDFRFRIPASIDTYRDRLVALFPSETRGIDRYIHLVRQVSDIGARIDKNRGRLSPGIIWSILMGGLTLAINQNRTFDEFLGTSIKDPQLKAVILGQSGDYGLPPSEVSALLHAGLGAHYFRGAYYPKGGGQIIADKLAARIEALGGSIHLKCGIEQILVEDGRAVGVKTEPRRGQSYTVRAKKAVVSGADIRRTLKELLPPDALTPKWAKRVDGWQMGGAIFMTFLGVQRDMKQAGMTNSNYWQFDHYDMERFYQVNRTSPDPQPQGCYITSATQKDPGTTGHHAPDGIESVEVMTIVNGDNTRWGVEWDDIQKWRYKKSERYLALKQRIEDDMVARFETLFPGSKDKIVYRESATPITHTRYTRASAGTGYGLACTPAQFNDGRPGARGPVSSMYLCGASNRAGHGIVGAMLNGFYAALAVGKDTGTQVG